MRYLFGCRRTADPNPAAWHRCRRSSPCSQYSTRLTSTAAATSRGPRWYRRCTGGGLRYGCIVPPVLRSAHEAGGGLRALSARRSFIGGPAQAQTLRGNPDALDRQWPARVAKSFRLARRACTAMHGLLPIEVSHDCFRIVTASEVSETLKIWHRQCFSSVAVMFQLLYIRNASRGAMTCKIGPAIGGSRG